MTAGTREISLGEVLIRKRIIEEEQLVPIKVRREVVEVIRLAPGETLDSVGETRTERIRGTDRTDGKELPS